MASGKVESLTDAQWDDARAVRGEYLAASICTDPADRPAAESALSRMYELAGHKVPQFIWCQSPAAVRLVIRMLSPRAGGPLAGALGWRLDDSLEKSPLREADQSLRRSLKGALGVELGRALKLRLGGRSLIADQLFAASADNVMWRPLQSLLATPLGESVKESLQGMLWPPDPDPRWDPPQEREPRLVYPWTRNGGQFESWMTEFDVPRRLGLVTYGQEDSERLDLWCTLVRSCGWWLPYGRICVVAERPAVVGIRPVQQEGGSRFRRLLAGSGRRGAAVTPIPAGGVVVATGQEGHEHRLLPGPARFDPVHPGLPGGRTSSARRAALLSRSMPSRDPAPTSPIHLRSMLSCLVGQDVCGSQVVVNCFALPFSWPVAEVASALRR